ncbi:hypothetical protein DH2020_045522 [Rehmannia glutinosa]|uniref:Uncharacterized protein n=1 Tax=Rehmannia glutinosa TaxID=99300 RepID=A0ABR0UDY0_REHGL
MCIRWLSILGRFDDTGFKVNGVKYEGSLLCVGNLVMSWTPKNFSEITVESLSIFKTLRPIPGENSDKNACKLNQASVDLRDFDSWMWKRNAASTYNILNEEGRIVAAALIPYGVDS